MTAGQVGFWRRFLIETGRPGDTPMRECFSFGMEQALSDNLPALVSAGRKTP